MIQRTLLRRLEALEKEERLREQKALSSLQTARLYIWMIVLAYYLGDLRSDEKDPGEAEARALKYRSSEDYSEAVLKVMRNRDTKDISEIRERFVDAYRRLFADMGLDFDNAPPNVLFDAFVTGVNQRPDQWSNWLSSNLRRWCPDAEIAAGSNLPRRLSGENLFLFV